MEVGPTFDVDDATDGTTMTGHKGGSMSPEKGKTDAMAWLKRLDEPSDEELIAAVTHKPDEFSGSTFATPVSQVRVTGDAFYRRRRRPSSDSRGKLRDSARSTVQQVVPRHRRVDRQPRCSGTAERGGRGKIASALLGTNKENDRKLLDLSTTCRRALPADVCSV